MSLASTYQSRKELLASILNSRGVSASSTEGLTSLITKVANIPPTVVNMVFSTSISAYTTSDIALVGGSVMVNGVLKCFYDDTTPVNVDLDGELQGATVKIYNGNTLLGSCVSDTDGVFSFQYTPETTGVLSLVAVFEGTTEFPACVSSSMSVEVLDNATLTLTSDKDTVALNNQDSAVLTATLVDDNDNPVVGQTINFMIDGSVVGSSVTDSAGEATYTYDATGAGDVDIVASFAGLCRETCQIIDFFVQNTLTENHNPFEETSNITITTDNTGTTFKSTNSTRYSNKSVLKGVPFDIDNNSYDVEFTILAATTADNTPIRWRWSDEDGNNEIRSIMVNTTVGWHILDSPWIGSGYNLSYPTILKFHVEKGNCVLYRDGVQVASITDTSSMEGKNVYLCVIPCEGQRYIKLKDFTVKKL